jgi:hypothetical protein
MVRKITLLLLLSLAFSPVAAIASTDVLPVFDSAAVVPIIGNKPNLIIYDSSGGGSHSTITTESLQKKLGSAGRAPKLLSKSTLGFLNTGGDALTATLLVNNSAITEKNIAADAVVITLDSYRYLSNLGSLDTTKPKFEKTLTDLIGKGVIPAENAGTVSSNYYAAYRLLTERDTPTVFIWEKYQIIHPDGLRSFPDDYAVQFYEDKHGTLTLGVDSVGTPYLLWRIK